MSYWLKKKAEYFTATNFLMIYSIFYFISVVFFGLEFCIKDEHPV